MCAAMQHGKHRPAFSLIEILVALGIIGLLVAFVVPNLIGTRSKARDTKRRSDLATIGRFMSLSCYIPEAGAGDYDLMTIANELVAKHPTYASFLGQVPKDPSLGNDAQSGYRYQVSSVSRCVLYANLEREEESVTLQVTAPTPGGGTGVLQAATAGPNGSTKYYQFSN